MTADVPVGGPDFASLLRVRRGSTGLTQTELAERAGLAVRTVRDVERGRTGRVQRTTAVLLADALGLTGQDRYEFLAAARGERVAAARGVPLPPAPRRAGREAEATRLAGREAEVTRLSEELTGDAAVISLVGVSGVGKSALAAAVVRQVADQFPGGVAGITATPSTVAPDIVTAGTANLAGDGPALLVVDGADRAGVQVSAALPQLPSQLRVLAAGRAPLGASGERVWPVLPLEVPPAGIGPDLATVARYPAAAMLLERLARVRPDPPAEDEVLALVGLVRRLGGFPLALELAAAHGALLRVPEILKRYGARILDLGGVPELGGVPGPDQPLREAVAGSYRLLDAAAQRALRRLAVFRDRWSLALAEQLLGTPPEAAGGEDPVPLLDRLMRLGLVQVGGVRENRYRLLEVVREFGAEQAAAHQELGAARRAHAVVITRLAGRTGTDLAGPGMPEAAARLDELSADVWAALNHAANDDPATALRLASHLSRWWRLRGRDVAGRRWLRRLLDDPRTAGADPAVRAWAQFGLAQLAHAHGEGRAELPAAEAALVEFRRLGDVGGELAAGTMLSRMCWAVGRYDAARTYTEAALVEATRTGQLREVMIAQHLLVRHEVRAGDLAAARRRLALVERLAAQSGEQRVRALAAADLAEVARLQERYEEAVATGRRVLARLGELGDPGHRQRVLATLGQAFAVLHRSGEAERALAGLRAELPEPGSRTPAGEGRCAAIEGRLAMVRGDQVSAAEWFASAANAFQGLPDRRELVEALVCLAACTPEPEAGRQVRQRLERVLAEDGFMLLPAEQALLRQAPGPPAEPGSPVPPGPPGPPGTAAGPEPGGDGASAGAPPS